MSRTAYVYDDDGRLVESVTVHDPEWLPEDLATVLAHRADKAAHCPRCGERDADWRDEQGRPLPDPPRLPVPSVCPACETLETVQEAHKGTKHARWSWKPAEQVDLDALLGEEG